MEHFKPEDLAGRFADAGKDVCIQIEGAYGFDKYPAKQHARRVVEKLGVTEGLIYLPGTPTVYWEDSDQARTFHQRRYFYYITGSDEADQHATYDIDRDELTLFIPKNTLHKVIYNGKTTTIAEAKEKYDVDEVLHTTKLIDYMKAWPLHNAGQVFVLHLSQVPDPEFIPRSRVDVNKLQRAMDAARVIKDDHEINLIRKANKISAAAHAAVLKNIAKFKSESQVYGLFLDSCISQGAVNQAYEVIAASGENAAVLHYQKNNELFGDRQLMILDAGAEWECYASDVTRTFPLSGSWPSQEAKSIYDLVQKMQDAAVALLGPGVRYYDLHKEAHKVAVEGLLELGILHNGSPEEILKAGTSLAFFPHGLGHHLGLDVHDVSDVPLNKPYNVKNRGKNPVAHSDISVYQKEMCRAPVHPESGALEEGMVVTIEPGIYFSRYALVSLYLPHPVHSKYINTEVLNKYIPVGGVRIEDDYLVTSKGFENLTTAPKGEEMLALIRGDSETEALGESPVAQKTAVPETKTALVLKSANSDNSSSTMTIRPARSSSLKKEVGLAKQEPVPQALRDKYVKNDAARDEGRNTSQEAIPSTLPTRSKSLNQPRPPPVQDPRGCQHNDEMRHVVWIEQTQKAMEDDARRRSGEADMQRDLQWALGPSLFENFPKPQVPPKLPALPEKPLAYRQSQEELRRHAERQKEQSKASVQSIPEDRELVSLYEQSHGSCVPSSSLSSRPASSSLYMASPSGPSAPQLGWTNAETSQNRPSLNPYFRAGADRRLRETRSMYDVGNIHNISTRNPFPHNEPRQSAEPSTIASLSDVTPRPRPGNYGSLRRPLSEFLRHEATLSEVPSAPTTLYESRPTNPFRTRPVVPFPPPQAPLTLGFARDGSAPPPVPPHVVPAPYREGNQGPPFLRRYHSMRNVATSDYPHYSRNRWNYRNI